MAEVVEFGQISNNVPQKGMILYLPKSGSSITVRFVGVQQKIYTSWNNDTKSFSYYEEKKEGSYNRFISFIIDRSDERVKAFVCPFSIFKQLGDYGISHDFLITRHGHGLSTKYTVKSLGEYPVSDEIINKVNITSKTYPLLDIFMHKIKWELLDTEQEPINNRFDILDL